MPIQPSLRRTQTSRSGRVAAHRMNFPKVGQCFEVEVTRETDAWLIRIPEIGGIARASRRSTVESVARECVAARTGIPIGYIAIFIAKETR